MTTFTETDHPRDRVGKFAEKPNTAPETTLPTGKELSFEEQRELSESYFQTALWSTSNDDGGSLDDEYDVSDIDERSVESMEGELYDFVEINWADIEPVLSDTYTLGSVAHDFWLTRNRHGAGFWDRGLGDAGKRLTEAAHVYGNADLYVGDDGALHVT